jgi:hypothetical protein
MSPVAQIELVSAAQVARQTTIRQALNGICYGAFGENQITAEEMERMVQAVPALMAGALRQKAYYFVPLTLGERSQHTETETLVAPAYSVELGDRAICHRNVTFGSAECVFISTRLMDDRFALAFEFFINIGHAFVDVAGVPQSFSDLVWAQAEANVRGETSHDAWESRSQALTTDLNNRALRVDEKAKSNFLESAFSDAIAIYLLSLFVDFDYAELREREYPLLAPQALAERLRQVAQLFPPNDGYDFAVLYRRKH